MKLIRNNILVNNMIGLIPHVVSITLDEDATMAVELYKSDGVILSVPIALSTGDSVFFGDVLKITVSGAPVGYSVVLTINNQPITLTDGVAYYSIALFDDANIVINVSIEPVNIAAIGGVIAPVKGGTPARTVTETDEYTGSILLNPADGTFAPEAIYTAIITLTQKTGYTFTGVEENFFTVDGATSVTNSADSGVITAVFPETEKDIISIAAINGVIAPVTGATPVTTITASNEYAGTVAWAPNDATFVAETVYTATISLTRKTGYTLVGVPADFFTVSGATATNAADSGEITAVFPATEIV